MDATRSSPLRTLWRLLELWKLIKGKMQCLGPSVWRLLRIIITRVMNSIPDRLSLLCSNDSDDRPIQLHLKTGSYAAQTVPPPLPPLTTDNKLEVAPAKSTTCTSYSPALGPVVGHDSSPCSAGIREDINHLRVTLDDSTRTLDRVIQDVDMGPKGNVAQPSPEIASSGEDLSAICFCLFPKDIASRSSRAFFMYVVAYFVV
jgi:hypothetical protein